MTRLLLLAALLLVGCTPGTPVDGGSGINYHHDAAHAVSCWQTSSYNLSCLPDSVTKQ